MSAKNIVRAWKDEEYRMSLGDSERAEMPDNPAGAVTLSDDEVDRVAGAAELTGLSFCYCWSWVCSIYNSMCLPPPFC
jgi:mersacidin/lichenicidin family type 2 lantibiotic